jgi:drug/metabolite transporter (DMT)-like permease
MPIPASAQKPASSEQDNAGLGILLMMGAVAAFAVIDTCAKVLVKDMQPFMVVFARYTLALIYVIASCGGLVA